jgi:hypothetical protein
MVSRDVQNRSLQRVDSPERIYCLKMQQQEDKGIS